MNECRTQPRKRRDHRAVVSLLCLGVFLSNGTCLAASGAFSPFSESFVQAQYDRIAPAIVVVFYSVEITNPVTGESTRRDNRAMGVLASESGLVLTHGHMQIENIEPFNIRVRAGRGEAEREYPAKLLQKPDDVNLCFIQIQPEPAEKLPHVTFRRGSSLALGEPVLIMTVLGETLDFTPSVLMRRVGAIIEKPRTTYCIDEPIGFGAVGGPVINARGEVVGLVGFDLSAQEGGELYVRSGHPLIYQTDLFISYIDNPPGESETPRARPMAWLGVFNQPLTDDLAEYWGLPKNGGVVVSSIVPGSPAANAGFQRGDVIVEFDGTPIRARQNREVLGFSKLVRDTGPGKTVFAKVLRDGAPIQLEVTLTERPKAARDAEEFEDTVFGLTMREITTDLRIRLNLSDDVQGVIVSRVRSGSWAQIAGMRPGVIIMNMGGRPVANLDEYESVTAEIAEQRPGEIAVFCRVGTQTGFFRIKPRWEATGTETERP